MLQDATCKSPALLTANYHNHKANYHKANYHKANYYNVMKSELLTIDFQLQNKAVLDLLQV